MLTMSKGDLRIAGPAMVAKTLFSMRVLTAVLGLGVTACATVVVLPVRVPDTAEGTYPFYAHGKALGSVDLGSRAFGLVQLEPDHLGGNYYMRLWFQYMNQSDEPVLLDPQLFFELVTSYEGGAPFSCIPTPASMILAHLKNEKAAAMILQAIGGTLEQIAATSPVEEVVARDRMARNLQDTSYWYESFVQSVGTGLLRKHTVFPGQSVNGYVYFEIDRSELRKVNAWRLAENPSSFLRSMDFRHKLVIRHPFGETVVGFSTTLGE